MRNKELKIIEAYGAFMSILFSFLIVYEDVWTNILKIFLYTEIQYTIFICVILLYNLILLYNFTKIIRS
ncbi:hypothetical protein C3H43_08460 [Campylobacter jejuni]|nr:hypothetical protein C3H49_07520 [Campylobacter jejuni]RTJ92759.1 hypothetical protein C3H43_08460 [Campylobacter jejuni]